MEFQLMVDWWFGARWFGFTGFPYERDCYLRVPLQSQTTNPNHQLTSSWLQGIVLQKKKRLPNAFLIWNDFMILKLALKDLWSSKFRRRTHAWCEFCGLFSGYNRSPSNKKQARFSAMFFFLGGDRYLPVVGGFDPVEKYARQIGSFPQVGVKIENVWNHHPVFFGVGKICFKVQDGANLQLGNWT